MADDPNDSILDTTKKAIGIAADYEDFDIDIIMHINSVFSTLNQLGVGPDGGFNIQDNTAKWDDFIGVRNDLSMVKSYMALRVRLLFDPPTTSFALDSFQRQAQEFEWRLNIQTDDATTALSGGGN